MILILKNEDSHYFVTPKEQNNSAAALRETNAKTNKANIKLHTFILQQSPSTTTKPMKITPSVKYYVFFHTYEQNYQAAQCTK